MLSNLTTQLPLRFWRKVRVLDNGCWEWTAARNRGYGVFRVGSLTDNSRKQVYAHRLAYETLVGSVPEGLELDHLCRNRTCVALRHMEPVTHQSNVRRGNGPIVAAARQLAKTHCPKGHPYDDTNTYHYSTHRRDCRTCHRIRRGAKKT